MVSILKDLLFEENKLSLSRIILIILLMLSMGFWILGKDLTTSMLTIVLTCFGYVFGQKVLNNLTNGKNDEPE